MPSMQVALVMSERHGIGIDYCPQCRGVWLDHGELDKILERSAPADEMQHVGDRAPHDDCDRKGADYDRRPREKKSFWSELFD